MLSFYQFITQHPMSAAGRRQRACNHFSNRRIEDKQSSSSMTTTESSTLPVHALLDPTQRNANYTTTFPDIKLETLDLPSLKADVKRKRKKMTEDVVATAETPSPLPDNTPVVSPDGGHLADDEDSSDTPFPAPPTPPVPCVVVSSPPMHKKSRKSTGPKTRITPTLISSSSTSTTTSSSSTTAASNVEKSCCKSCGTTFSKAYLAKREEKKRLMRAAAAQRRLLARKRLAAEVVVQK